MPMPLTRSLFLHIHSIILFRIQKSFCFLQLHSSRGTNKFKAVLWTKPFPNSYGSSNILEAWMTEKTTTTQFFFLPVWRWWLYFNRGQQENLERKAISTGNFIDHNLNLYKTKVSVDWAQRARDCNRWPPTPPNRSINQNQSIRKMCTPRWARNFRCIRAQ